VQAPIAIGSNPEPIIEFAIQKNEIIGLLAVVLEDYKSSDPASRLYPRSGLEEHDF